MSRGHDVEKKKINGNGRIGCWKKVLCFFEVLSIVEWNFNDIKVNKRNELFKE
jgi:hypothetical protein